MRRHSRRGIAEKRCLWRITAEATREAEALATKELRTHHQMKPE
jgi:hypothetical protein